MKGMLASTVEIKDLQHLAHDPALVFEQKLDGTRCLIRITTESSGQVMTEFLGRTGNPLKHTAAMQHFESIEQALSYDFPDPGEIVIDGELMIDTGEFWAFDIPYFRVEGAGDLVGPETPYWERRQHLAVLAEFLPHPFHETTIASTVEAKQALAERVRTEGGEGVMVKDLNAPYAPGERVKTVLKAKFVSTADVIVTAWTKGRNDDGNLVGSASFALLDVNGEEQALGSCSLIGKPGVQVGDVIEVAYLSYVPGGGLVQPRMVRTRPDRDPQSCGFEQLRIYSKKVLS